MVGKNASSAWLLAVDVTMVHQSWWRTITTFITTAVMCWLLHWYSDV